MGWLAVTQWTGDQSPSKPPSQSEMGNDGRWFPGDMAEAWCVREVRMDLREITTPLRITVLCLLENEVIEEMLYEVEFMYKIKNLFCGYWIKSNVVGRNNAHKLQIPSTEYGSDSVGKGNDFYQT